MTKGAAMMGLGYLKDQEAVPEVRKLLEDPDQYTRVIAATVLGMIGNTEGLEEALSGTMSKDRTIPLVSVQALGLIGDERALPRLEEMARDPKACCPDHVLLARREIA